MNNMNAKLSDISMHLQTLTNPKYSKQVEQAVENNDKNTLVKICNKAKIPAVYIGTVVSVVMAVSPMKWPELF
jgi:hypothetical protein